MPRGAQIQLRRWVALRKRPRFANIWPIDERAAKPPEGWTGWPEGKKFALVLLHDVDTERGQEKCLELAQIDEKMGFRSSFNFVPERYNVSSKVRHMLVKKGFEIGVHGLNHDGKLFSSREKFLNHAARINHYLKDWQSVGFVSPSMHRNLEWVHDLNVEYDASTFDTDPFEPQPQGVGTIFPFWVSCNSHNSTLNIQSSNNGFTELPYTLPQDHALFVIMRENSIDIWKNKLDWIAEQGGMALSITHPDYMNFNGKEFSAEEYPAKYYADLLKYVQSRYEGQYWHVLPKEMARYWSKGKYLLSDIK